MTGLGGKQGVWFRAQSPPSPPVAPLECTPGWAAPLAPPARPESTTNIHKRTPCSVQHPAPPAGTYSQCCLASCRHTLRVCCVRCLRASRYEPSPQRPQAALFPSGPHRRELQLEQCRRRVPFLPAVAAEQHHVAQGSQGVLAQVGLRFGVLGQYR